MPLTADGNGDIDFDLDIPEEVIAAGVHQLIVTLDNGRQYTAYYINKPNLSIEDLRQITATAGADLFAPIAQTFTLSEGRDVAAISLDINKGSGTDPVIVQIRNVNSGSEPGSKVFAESVVEATDIQSFGTWTRFDFEAIVPCIAGTEYCFVVLTRDVNYTIALAELGKPDISSGAIVSKQPASGVLLTSSNGAAWSVEQNRDLKFKIHGASYTATTKAVDLGTVTGSNITDIMIMGHEDLSSPDTEITYTVTLPDASTVDINNFTPTNLQGYQNGDFQVTANLTGTDKRSPILFPNTRLELAEIALTGVRHSVRFYCPDSFTFRVKLDVKIEGNGTFEVAVEDTTPNNYTPLVQVGSAVPLSDGFTEVIFEGTGLTEVDNLNLTSIRLTPTLPNPADRVYLRNLRSWAQ
ncbi:hypothetical protein [Cognatishimia sp.]|uniref:hypothetical protein n=1 Tax=Cognatishimia sp. TaxID=2211648 RepID=UPI003515083B|nr:hypothetical protein [Cognatishimia sp.]